MNFGAFGGGFAQGLDSGMRMGKTVRDLIKERNLEDLRTQGMEEAKAQRVNAVNGLITTEPPAPPSAATPAPEAPGTTQPSVKTAAAPSPTDSPDAASAATAASAMAPAAKAFKPRWEGDTGPGPNDAEIEARMKARQAPSASTQAPAAAEPTPGTATSIAQPTPQTTAAAVGVAGANPAVPAPAEKPIKVDGKFFVGGKGYATRDEAYKAADASAPSTLDFFMKNAVPKLQEAYIVNGDVAKADALGTWASNKQNQQSMVEWSKMYRAAQMGDMEKAADHAFNLYKKMDDGITPVSKETVKDKDGNVTGFNVRLKNDATGAVVSQFIDKRGLIEMGLSGLAPDKLFEMTFKRQAEADKAGMDARIKRGERVEKVQDQLTIEKYKEDRADRRTTKAGEQKITEIAVTKQLDAENMGVRERAQAESKIAMLKENGYSEDQIKAMIPAIVGAGEHKKTTDPAERAEITATELSKSDPRWSTYTQEQKTTKIKENMVAARNAIKLLDADASAKPAAPGAAPTAAAPGKPVYVKDTKTGEIFERRDGKLLPVKQSAAAPAPAAPASVPAPAPSAPSPTPAATAATGMPARTAPAPTPAPAASPAPAAPKNAADQILADKVAKLAPLAAQFKQADAMFNAAARSGDQASIAKYMEQKELIRKSLEQQVSEGFGNAAPAVMRQLMGTP